MAAPPLVSVLTLGCKLNLADSGEIAAGLAAAGFRVTESLCQADAFVVNTCSVTHVADQKSRKLVRSARRLAPGATVAITGCYPRTDVEAVGALGANGMFGTADADKRELVSFLTRALRPTPGGARLADDNGGGTLRTRAFVKAQEGCNDVCAFCIVPRTRGREASRDPVTVSREIARVVATGAREVVVTGTQLGAWGRDLDPPLVPANLLSAILERTEAARLRFSSLQPQDITPQLLALWDDPRLMPHFHLALQSGSDPILGAMRRRYRADEFAAAADRIRAAVPEAALTTDVIAGFPGESAADFQATMELCRAVGFARIHAFPYSPRARTAAAQLPRQVPSELRKERVQSLVVLSAELGAAFQSRFLGQVRPVLWEERRSGTGGAGWRGYTDNYIPVLTRSREPLLNRIVPARLCRAGDGHMLGEVVP